MGAETNDPSASRWLVDLVATERIGRQGVTTLGVVGASQALKLLVNVTGSLLLVRILGPEEFGLAAMALVVVSILLAFKDMGLSTATTQMSTISQAQVSTLFWFNQLFSVVGLALVLLLAPLVAMLFGQPEITNAIRLGAIVFPLAGLAAQHEALLRRNLAFRVLGVIEVLSMTLSIVVTVALARSGLGWWSLIAQRPVQLAVYCAGVWWRCSWRPSMVVDRPSVREPVWFGLHLTFSNFASVVSRTADNIAVGFYWGATSLGLYSKAYELLVAPLAQMAAPVGQALQSTLSRLRSDPVRYSQAASYALSASLMVLTPIGLLMAVESTAVTRIVLGEDWDRAAPMVGWFGLGVCYQLAGTVLSWVLVTQNRGRTISRTTASLTLVNLVTFMVAARFGVVEVAAAYVVVGAVIRTPVLFLAATSVGLFDRRRAVEALDAPLLAAAATLLLYAVTNRSAVGPLYLMWQLILAYMVSAAVAWRTGLGQWCRSTIGAMLRSGTTR